MTALIACPETDCGAPLVRVAGRVDPRGGHLYVANPCGHLVSRDLARAAHDAGVGVWLEQVTGATLISAERARQHTEEGYSDEHDAEHASELPWAAWCYLDAVAAGRPDGVDPPRVWPWGIEHWKPGPTAVRMLVKAGALIAAEIDRRLAKGETP